LYNNHKFLLKINLNKLSNIIVKNVIKNIKDNKQWLLIKINAFLKISEKILLIK